ncbi:DNA mismatch repair endonuclease MutH [Vulgatibacter incomptus]|uniref:DNA mismatch repair endonuclease MutH n=1 Tax=Vulgatibacter incomptus TaxID=1391653 RepID=UPI00068206D1|nr:DNA mismatch repair endonuclease MutH [Vulgatibacter incomptus]
MFSFALVSPPASEAELLGRARSLAGHPLGAIAERHAVPLADVSRSKGWIGKLLEISLGATASSRGEPDFQLLGVELKTVPVDLEGRPKESTFVCSAPLETMGELSWERSPVREKLARVLWVPIEATPEVPVPYRRIGMPLLWSPSPEEEVTLKRDWDELSERVGKGHVEEITAHIGCHLQLRPKGANARSARWGVNEEGDPIRTLPRAFYLRASFVREVLARGYAPSGRSP